MRHADHILRKGNKNSSLSEIEDQLRNFIDLFKYVEDKDLFQRFYSKKLANRLIHNTSVSIELEEVAISGLKVNLFYCIFCFTIGSLKDYFLFISNKRIADKDSSFR